MRGTGASEVRLVEVEPGGGAAEGGLGSALGIGAMAVSQSMSSASGQRVWPRAGPGLMPLPPAPPPRGDWGGGKLCQPPEL